MMPQTVSNASSAPDTGSSSELVVALQDVTFGYDPSVPVIRSVGASLSGGRLTALIGPNASGKSTLLRLMLGHLTPWRGEVTLGGEPVRSLSFSRRASFVSYVPQRGGMSFAFTVRQVVAMGRYALDTDGGAVDRAIEVCDLTDIQGRTFAQLSGGQQQRVLLARAVAQSAGSGRVMLLDEPASGMDLRHIHQTMRLLSKLARDGLAVLVVMHDVNLAARYADDVWLMDGGDLAAVGSCEQVMQPDRLSAVYGVRFELIRPPDSVSGGDGRADSPGSGARGRNRPVFWIEPADTID